MAQDGIFENYVHLIMEQADISEEAAVELASDCVSREFENEERHLGEVRDLFNKLTKSHFSNMGLLVAVIPLVKAKADSEDRDFYEAWGDLMALGDGFASGLELGLKGTDLLKHAVRDRRKKLSR